MFAQPPNQDGPSLVSIENMSLAFDGQLVLREINLHIPKGQTVAIIGESGCGKTVLMKTIIGLLQPTSGQVIFDSQEIYRLGSREQALQRQRFGFVFQNAALFDSMSVGRNIAFPLKQKRNPPSDEEIRREVFSRLAEVGLPDSVARKRPAELSGGMRKRVGLARALIMQPELMLYDEPTTGLDPIMSDVINQLILHTREKHEVTSIIITHDMRTVQAVADRVIMLYPLSRLEPDENQILFDGHPEELDYVSDRRVVQFVQGEAGERLMELRAEQTS
ncbi:MAG: ATP-binding cassette domain-containing protein [Pirellulaceae bacterium]|nr:ATP-binding cassette domain-containing protein [Pirellulaceae bacterium]